jgi:hypothetical protein
VKEARATHLSLFEEVWQKLHSVGPDDRNVLILSRVLNPEGLDAVCDVVYDLNSYFHACPFDPIQTRIWYNTLGIKNGEGEGDVPNMRTSGYSGAKAANKPPNPHPTSAHSTLFDPGPPVDASSLEEGGK